MKLKKIISTTKTLFCAGQDVSYGWEEGRGRSKQQQQQKRRPGDKLG